MYNYIYTIICVYIYIYDNLIQFDHKVAKNEAINPSSVHLLRSWRYDGHQRHRFAVGSSPPWL